MSPPNQQHPPSRSIRTTTNPAFVPVGCSPQEVANCESRPLCSRYPPHYPYRVPSSGTGLRIRMKLLRRRRSLAADRAARYPCELTIECHGIPLHRAGAETVTLLDDNGRLWHASSRTGSRLADIWGTSILSPGNKLLPLVIRPSVCATPEINSICTTKAKLDNLSCGHDIAFGRRVR